MWYAAKNAYVLNKRGAKPNFNIIDFVRQFEEEKERVAAGTEKGEPSARIEIIAVDIVVGGGGGAFTTGESSCPRVVIDTISKELQEILDGKESKTLAKEFVEVWIGTPC